MPTATDVSVGQVQMASTESLSLPLLAERIAHEREARLTAADYERQLREKADENERQTRELVGRLRDEARANERDRIEERLTVLNNERQRQETDRATFATRNEVAIGHAALEDKTSLGISKVEVAIEALGKNLSAEVRTLREQAREELGKSTGQQGVQSWLAPNLGSIIAIVVGLVALYLFLSGQGG